MKYVIDTSVLIDLYRRYPQDVFPSLWDTIESMIEEGRWVAPEQVLTELKKGHDNLYSWANQRRNMFIPLLPDVQRCLNELTVDFPGIVNPDELDDDADPFLVAVARTFSPPGVVITHERRSNPLKPRIPDVCKHYGIQCIGILDFFRKQGWKFMLSAS